MLNRAGNRGMMHHRNMSDNRQIQKWKKKSTHVIVFYIIFLLALWWCARFVVVGWLFKPITADIVSQQSPIDVIGVAYKPTCVTEISIRNLNKYLNPRNIYVFTTSQRKCKKFISMAHNIKCYFDGDVVSGVNKQSIEKFLEDTFGDVYLDALKSGKKVSGWYLQQFVKLGVVRYLKDLSENFLIWDLDMIPLKKLEPFTSTVPPKAKINIGGVIHIHEGYALSYEKLTNRSIEIAPDGSSFVTHSLAVKKSRMEELLQKFEGGEKDSWPWKILESITPKYIDIGFSEYASYVSWMIQNHPNEVHVKSRKTWRRYPPGASFGVAFQSFISPTGLCCPTNSLVNIVKPFGYDFMGFEIGHSNFCGYHKPQYNESYGISSSM